MCILLFYSPFPLLWPTNFFSAPGKSFHMKFPYFKTYQQAQSWKLMITLCSIGHLSFVYTSKRYIRWKRFTSKELLHIFVKEPNVAVIFCIVQQLFTTLSPHYSSLFPLNASQNRSGALIQSQLPPQSSTQSCSCPWFMKLYHFVDDNNIR